MQLMYNVQGWAMLALWVIFLGVEAFALFEAMRAPAARYVAFGKLTKPVWCGILAVATLMGVIAFPSALGLPGIIGIVASGVFLADVRPVVRNGGGSTGGW